jgi:hypothetical protein
MSDEQRPEGMEHDPVALHKDHDTVAQQRAEKEKKEKHPKPADYAETDKELAQKGGRSEREEERSHRLTTGA